MINNRYRTAIIRYRELSQRPSHTTRDLFRLEWYKQVLATYELILPVREIVETINSINQERKVA